MDELFRNLAPPLGVGLVTLAPGSGHGARIGGRGSGARRIRPSDARPIRGAALKNGFSSEEREGTRG